MGPKVPSTILSQFRKRRKISLDGQIPGVLYAGYSHSQQPASGPIDRSASANAPHTYMSFHPDAYEPHPGEPIIRDAQYTPYQTETPRFAPDELRDPEFNVTHAEQLGSDIDSDHAAFLLQRFVNDLPNRPAPDVIPAEHDVCFEGPTGPTLDVPGDAMDPVDAIWNRVLDQPSYDALPMLNELFDQAMHEAIGPAENLDPVFGDELTVDDVALGLDGTVRSDDMATDVPYDMPSLGPGLLEQIVDELGSLPLEPDPVMQERLYRDDLLMDPWMMPGIGPSLPGLGPMGPMGPLGPVM
ncbi:MAG: hypothetical protein JXQ75_11520 [Phycisphaerae bacterium]|nr:hypothetical protein [Phycisphaerae bacterium]